MRDLRKNWGEQSSVILNVTECTPSFNPSTLIRHSPRGLIVQRVTYNPPAV